MNWTMLDYFRIFWIRSKHNLSENSLAQIGHILTNIYICEFLLDNINVRAERHIQTPPPMTTVDRHGTALRSRVSLLNIVFVPPCIAKAQAINISRNPFFRNQNKS